MAKRVDISETPYLRALLYGVGGSTKTRTAATAAWDERTSPALMLEAGGNPVSIRDYGARVPDIVHVDSLKEFNPLYNWLAGGQSPNDPLVKALSLNPPYKSVVVDSITEVQRYSFNLATGNSNVGPGEFPKQVGRQEFGQVLAQMITFARLFLSLPMHVVLTSLESEKQDEITGGIQYRPLLWGQSGGEVVGYAYLVARMVHRGRLEKRQLKVIDDTIEGEAVSVALLRPGGNFVAKDQYGMGVTFVADPTIGKFMDLIEAGNPNQTNPT